MRTLSFCLLFLLTCASECFAHGSVARGYEQDGSTVRFDIEVNAPTAYDAQINALKRCLNRGLYSCVTDTDFANVCISIASFPRGPEHYSFGATIREAQARAVADCAMLGKNCSPVVQLCDRTAGAAPTVQSNAQNAQVYDNFSSFLSNLDFDAITLYAATCAFALFVLLSLYDFAKDGHRSLKRLIINVVVSVAITAIGAVLFVSMIFAVPRFLAWVQSLSTPALVLLTTIFVGIGLLVVPLGVWRSSKQLFATSPQRTARPEGKPDSTSIPDAAQNSSFDTRAIKEAVKSRRQEFEL